MRRPRVRVLALLVGIGLAVGVAGGATYAAFFATTSNTGNSFSAAGDYTAPTIGASVIQRNATAYLAGSIRPSAAYYVYANVTDSGNPASGIASVTANVTNITAGQTSAVLTAGAFTVQGVAYNYRSASLTADAGLTSGAKSYTVTAADVAGNAATGTYSVTVDTTAPTGSDVQTANKPGGTAGKAEAGDTITFTYSEQIDPQSILAGWTGASTPVMVKLNNGTPGNDALQIWNAANSAQLPLGSVDLGRTDYVNGNRAFGSSTMVQSGNSIVVTLGGTATTTTAGGTGTMTWTPSATALDAAGNACSTAVVTESGAADAEF